MVSTGTDSFDIFTVHPLPAQDQSAMSHGTVTSDIDVFAILRDDTTGHTDVYRTKARHSTLSERDLYDDYRIELFENPLVGLLVNYLLGELMSFHFEGDASDLEKVRLAWDNLDIDSQLTTVARQGILLGNGFADKEKKGKEMTRFDDIDAATVEIERDEDTREETFKQGGEDLKRENLFVLRLLEYPDTPYGMSFLRSSIKAIQGLGSLGDDIPAAIKRLAYAEKILKLDMSDIEDPKKKSDALKKAKERFAKYDSATAQVTAMDNRHDLKYVGAEGGGIQRIIPLMGVIEPILAFVIMNFYMAIGHVMQTGANKALLQEQEKRARRALLPLKRKFARVIEREIIADILGVEIDFKGKKPLTQALPVRVVHDRDSEEIQSDTKLGIQLYVAGAIPRELLHKLAGFDPAEPLLQGGTYFYDTPLGQQLGGGPQENAQQAPDKNAGANRSGKGGPSGFSQLTDTLQLQAEMSRHDSEAQ